MKPDHPIVAKVVEYGGIRYRYKSAKRNVLVYVNEPYRDYYGYCTGGHILIIQYNGNPNIGMKQRYYILHKIDLFGGTSVDTSNLTKCSNRFATPIFNC